MMVEIDKMFTTNRVRESIDVNGSCGTCHGHLEGNQKKLIITT